MKKNILIYPSGAENAIELYNSIKDSVDITVIAASGKADISELIYRNKVEYLPYVQSENFIEALNTLIKDRNIHYIFPTHDSISLFLSQCKDQIDCEIITSSYETNRICRFKRETYKVFKGFDFCPNIFEGLVGEKDYPIFSKPNVGQGSKGIFIVQNRDEHAGLMNSEDDLLFVEYLPGKEFTIDCFTNRNGALQFVGPRERIEIQMGISFRSKSVVKKDQLRFIEIAEQINAKLEFRGLWFFQLKEDNKGTLKLLEISTRASGTMGYFRHMGVNLPLITLSDYFGLDSEIVSNTYDLELYRATHNRYKYSNEYSSVYIDFNNTIFNDGSLNITLISFIYQCKNLNKSVYLLVNAEDLYEDILIEYNICKTIFDKIIVLNDKEKKSDLIEKSESIFIGNCLTDKKELVKLKVPVIAVDMVNSLLFN